MKKILLPLLSFFFLQSSAQLAVDTTLTPQQAVEDIFLSNGIFISNVTYNGLSANTLNAGVGTFTSNGSGLGIESGLILSTGQAIGAEGDYNLGSAATSVTNGIPNDIDIAGLVSGPSFDGSILEFDFIATGDSMDFVYVFGSEEYEEFVGSAFNDVFGFFVNGPGINGSFWNGAVNIALIPGTTDPVAINTVNANYNSAYFVVNTGQIQAQYDAYTTPLHACIGGLQIGEVYHIKLAIADVSDQILDSGVFLSGNSFVQACTDGTRSEDCLLCEIRGHVTYTEECGTLLLNNASQINLATTGCRYEIGDDVVLPSCDGVVEYSFDQPGTYTIKLIYEVGDFYSTFTIGDVYVSTTPPTQPIILQTGSTLSVSNVETEASYQWYLNGTAIPGATTASFDATESGAYAVTAVNGCLSVSSTFNAIVSGLQETYSPELMIYPNPAESMFTIQYASGTAQVQVLDLAGRTVFASATNGKISERITLSPGVYTIITRNNAGVSNGIERVVVR
ncbi:MAG: choice-of-anchor L domain-containing protein [Flavobacteriales bacterium]|jgi:hypothetical protein